MEVCYGSVCILTHTLSAWLCVCVCLDFQVFSIERVKKQILRSPLEGNRVFQKYWLHESSYAKEVKNAKINDTRMFKRWKLKQVQRKQVKEIRILDQIQHPKT